MSEVSSDYPQHLVTVAAAVIGVETRLVLAWGIGLTLLQGELVVLLGLSLWVLVAAPAPRQDESPRFPLTLVVQALLVAGISIYLVLYVVGEDPYRDNGMSRWQAYDAHLLTVAAAVAGFATSALALAATRGRRLLARAAGAVGLVASLLLGAAFLANSLN